MKAAPIICARGAARNIIIFNGAPTDMAIIAQKKVSTHATSRVPEKKKTNRRILIMEVNITALAGIG